MSYIVVVESKLANRENALTRIEKYRGFTSRKDADWFRKNVKKINNLVVAAKVVESDVEVEDTGYSARD